MTGASLALIVILGQVPTADPVDLVSKLGASRYADRESASTSLVQLGRRSLPALRMARDQRDPEIRARAAALITRIEGALLTQPSMVTLDFEDVALTDVLKSFGDQTGIKLSLIPENSPTFRLRKVTLHEAAPVPFWKAIDQLCDAARLQYNFGVNHYQSGREPNLPLFDNPAAGRPLIPVSDSGPFRVSVTGLHFQRDVTFPMSLPQQPFGQNPNVRGPFVKQAPKREPQQGDPAKPAPLIYEQFYAQLQVSGEPRLAISVSGNLKITEAVDDKGQYLVTPVPGNGPTSRNAAYFGFATGPVFQLQAPMTRPIAPGGTIKKFKGVIPVNVSTRKPNPLVISLADSTGRTFQNDDVALSVHEIRAQGNNRPPSIEITLRPNANASASAGNEPAAALRPDSYQQQIEITDAQGRPVPWYQTSFDVESGRMTMTTSPEQVASATELRYYSLVRASADVPFEFSDIPLP